MFFRDVTKQILIRDCRLVRKYLCIKLYTIFVIIFYVNLLETKKLHAYSLVCTCLYTKSTNPCCLDMDAAVT